MRRYILFCVWLVSILGLAQAQTTPTPLTPLRVGMLPSLSTQKLFERFAPLREYLQQKLQRPIILITAPDYQTYIERAHQHEYDLFFTAPHMAALVEQQYGYRRISMLTRDLEGFLVVHKNGPIQKIHDLKNKIVAAPESLAIITMTGESLLEKNGLIPGKTVTMEYTPSHNNALLAVIHNKASAAIVSTAVFDSTAAETHDQLIILDKTQGSSHMMFMASPRLSENDYRVLRDAMLSFTATGPGREFFQRSQYGDMGEITDAEMKKMLPYVKILKQRIAESKNSLK